MNPLVEQLRKLAEEPRISVPDGTLLYRAADRIQTLESCVYRAGEEIDRAISLLDPDGVIGIVPKADRRQP